MSNDPVDPATSDRGAAPPVLSIVTPAFNETENLPVLQARIAAALSAGPSFEWIIVDDHSADGTFAAIATMAGRDPRVRGLRLARNEGSHAAIRCGLEHARGLAACILPADLQEPPELIPELLARWRQGARIVWAARESDRPPPLVYRLIRAIPRLSGYPPHGVDAVLLDRRVVDSLARHGERNVNLYALIASLGFTQASVPYRKGPRRAGQSGWTLARRLTLFVDTITAFTFLPIRVMSLLGVATAVLGFIYAVFVVFNALAGEPPEGWSSLIIAVLLVGGLIMTMLGVLGEYLWRALDEARGRPRYTIEASTDDAPPC